MQLRLSRLTMKFALPTVGLILFYLAVQSFVQAFRNPNQMDFVKSLTMDMTVQVPPGAMPGHAQPDHGSQRMGNCQAASGSPQTSATRNRLGVMNNASNGARN